MKKLLSQDEMLAQLSILPLKVWSAQKGHGSFLTFDAGDKIIKANELNETKYTWQLYIWIYLCDWELYQNEKLILSSAVEDEKIYEEALRQLIGLSITQIEEHIPHKSVTITLSGGYHIFLKTNLDVYEKEDDLLMIFIEKQPVISYSPQNAFYIDL